MSLWVVVAARPGARSDEPRHRQRGAGSRRRSRRPTAERAAGGGAGRRDRDASDVRIDWNGLARRARRLTVPGTTLGALTSAPEGHSVALTVSTAGAGGGRGAGDADAGGGMFIVNVESGQLTRVPPAAAVEGSGRGGRGAAPGGGFGGGVTMAFARDGRTLYFRSARTCLRRRSTSILAARARRRRGGAGGGRRRSLAAAAAVRPMLRRLAPATRPPRHVTYTRHARSGSSRAARAGVQRGLADHEEPVLRREDARRELERRARDVRAAARGPRRRGRAAHDHDDDDRPSQRLAHRA